MLNKNHKYIKFILSKLKNSLYTSGFDITGSDANKALAFLMSSDDVLRDIFVLSRHKQCGSFCSYLLFVYKKLDENALKYENLPVNIEYDVEYLKRIIIGSFKLNKSNGEAAAEVETGTTVIENNQGQQWEVSDEISESKFKVGEIERDIVTEEFSEDEIDINRLKDLNPEDEENIEEIISVSLAEVKESFAEAEEPESEIDEIVQKTQAPDEEPIEPEELKEEAFDLSDLIESKHTGQKPAQNELFYQYKEDDEKEKQFEGETIPEEMTEEKSIINNEEEKEAHDEEDLDENSIIEISTENLEVTREEKTDPKDKFVEYEDTQILEENETLVPESAEQEETEIFAADEKSKKFVDFENRLISTNKEMNKCFEEIKNLIKNYDENNSIIKDKSESVSRNAFMLSKATGEMTFEIISNIYNFTGNYFDKANEIPFEIRQKDLATFSLSLYFIEKFILEEDFSGIEKILGDYYDIEKYVEEMELQRRTIDESEEPSGTFDKTPEETIEKPVESSESSETGETSEEENIDEQEKLIETERVLYEKKEPTEKIVTESDSRKKMMMVLKAEIMELEIIFKSIDEIEGNYKTYEGLRKLSKTYNILKKTVVLSKRLDMKKLARLSEACYIFIKFIQNYRLSPFDEDIKQIFNYIIYNYKLIALDKPTKDFEEFVFYLNDPVKIFTQKKKN